MSVGVTVGMGITGAWWIRVLAGVGTTALLVVAKVGTNAGRGPLARSRIGRAIASPCPWAP